MLPHGFKAGGIRCGIKKKAGKKDLAVFYSDRPAVAVGMFTRNLVKAAPVLVSAAHLKRTAGTARAILANAGCANACTGQPGRKDAEDSCALLAARIGVKPEEVLVASTGVIGQPLPMNKIIAGIESLVPALGKRSVTERSAADAIMTTDTMPKIAERTVRIAGRRVTVWGCAKGSGMIHPDLASLHATMFAFILTDASIRRPLLQQATEQAVAESFNCVSVDGDTSTNDTVLVLANGAAGGAPLSAAGAGYGKFASALKEVCLDLAKMIARDGEGATRLVEIEIRKAATGSGARKIAATIATSPLVKTAVFGNDANWGRILAAAGRAGVAFDPGRTDIYLSGMLVARSGKPVNFSEARAAELLRRKEVGITVVLNQGKHSARYYTCDLSFGYIKINASYRS